MHADNPKTTYSAYLGMNPGRLITVSGSAHTVPVSHRDIVIFITKSIYGFFQFNVTSTLSVDTNLLHRRMSK